MRHDVSVTTYRIAEAAELLGVSDDTVRRWVEAGRVAADTEDGRTVVPGADLAALAESLADHPDRERHPGGRGQRPQPAEPGSSPRS